MELDKRDELIKAQKELIAKQDELIADYKKLVEKYKESEVIRHKLIDNLERELKIYSLVYGSSHQN